MAYITREGLLIEYNEQEIRTMIIKKLTKEMDKCYALLKTTSSNTKSEQLISMIHQIKNQIQLHKTKLKALK